MRPVIRHALLFLVVSFAAALVTASCSGPEPDQTRVEGELMMKLRALSLRGDFDAIDEALEEAHARYGERAEFDVLAGVAVLETGWADPAAVYLRRAVEKDPENFSAWFQLGRALMEKDAQNLGVEEARKAISIGPKEPWGYLLLHEVYFRRAQLDDAVAALDEGLQHEELRRVPSLREEKCDALAAGGRYDEALPEARSLTEDFPDRPRGFFMLAYILAKRGDYGAAIEPGRRAAQLQPGNYSNWLELGINLSRMSRWEEARGALEKAKALNESDSAIRYNLAQVLARLGLKEEAQAEMEAYRELEPEGR